MTTKIYNYNKRVFKKITILFAISIQLNSSTKKEVLKKDFENTTLEDAISMFNDIVDINTAFSKVIRKDEIVQTTLDNEIRKHLDVRFRNWIFYYISSIDIFCDNKHILSVNLKPNAKYIIRKSIRFVDKIYKPKICRTPHIVIFVDTETRLQNNRHELMLGYYEIWTKNKNTYNLKERKFFTNRKDFWFAVSRSANKYAVYVFAWKAEFDFMILWEREACDCVGIVYERTLKRNESFCAILRVKRNKRRVYFVDAKQFANASLEEVGRILNIHKLDTLKRVNYDATKVNIEELKAYCRRDVEIMREYILKFIKFVASYGSFAPTLARVAFNVFRQSFMKTEIHTIHDKRVIELLQSAYFGGRCENFYVGYYNKQIAKLDVNSMYPFVMATKPLPARFVCYVEINNGDGIDELHYWISRGYLVVVDADVLVYPGRYGYVPVRQKDAVYFVKGYLEKTYRVVLCQPELKFVVIRKVHRFAVFEADYIFKDFVAVFWKIRKDAKARNDSVTELMAKSLMNSLYGKFAQKAEKYIECDVPWESSMLVMSRVTKFDEKLKQTMTHNMPTFKICNKLFTTVLTKKLATYNNIAISAFITSYARAYLLELMYRSSKVLYVDTDCIIIPATELNKYKDVIGDELGKLKCEIWDAIEIRAPKDYTLYRYNMEMWKVKGVPTNARRLITHTRAITYEYEHITRFRETLRLLANGSGLHSETLAPFLITQRKTLTTRCKGYIDQKTHNVEAIAVEDIEFIQTLRKCFDNFKFTSHNIIIYCIKTLVRRIKHYFVQSIARGYYHFCSAFRRDQKSNQLSLLSSNNRQAYHEHQVVCL